MNFLNVCCFKSCFNIYVVFLDGSDSKSEVTAALTSPNEPTHDDDDHEAPCLVVYLVEPFTLGTDNCDLQRLACLALLRCFQTILSSVPDHIRTNINVQVSSRKKFPSGRVYDDFFI